MKIIKPSNDSDILDTLTKKWVAKALFALEGRVVRFGGLRRNLVGVSSKTLSETLRLLERDGLVERRAFAVIPPRVEYRLTGLGTASLDALKALQLFADSTMDEVVDSRRSFDSREAEAKIDLFLS